MRDGDIRVRGEGRAILVFIVILFAFPVAFISLCLSIALSPQGLYLKPFGPFGLFHPAVFLPYSDVQVEAWSQSALSQCRISMACVNGVKLRFGHQVSQWLESETPLKRA